MKPEWNREFSSRFRRHEAEMTRLYGALYHGDDEAWDGFADMLYRAWEARSAPLREIDRQREDQPGWYARQDWTAMQADVDSFGGTLKGVQKRLDYFVQCGVGCLCLLPTQGSGESAADNEGPAELWALAGACRRRGISLCVDFPLSHTGREHPWARRARAGEKAYQERYFFYADRDLPNAYEQTLPPAAPGALGHFTWCGEAKRLVMTTRGPEEWDLNYANPAVLTNVLEALLSLCNQGAEAVRLGGMRDVWKAPGTACRDLPQTHALLRLLRMACDIVCPGVALLGDTAAAPGWSAAYFGTEERPECHLVFDDAAMPTLWHTVATRDARLLAHQLRQVLSLPRRCAFLRPLRTGDPIDWTLDYGFLLTLGQQEGPHRRYLNDALTGLWPGSPARGELYSADLLGGNACLCGTTASLCGVQSARQSGDGAAMERALRLDEMLHALLFTLSGVPLIRSGDEIARENDGAYRDDPAKRADSRWLHRGPMDGRRAALRSREGTPEGRMFAALGRLQARRREHPVFDTAADVWLPDTGSDSVLAIGRYWQGEQLLALFNFGDADAAITLNDEKIYQDLMSGAETDARTVPVPSGGFRWLLHRF